MAPKSKVVVLKDANIVIDMVNIGVFALWFRLGYETWTTDLILEELRIGKQWRDVEAFVASGNLKVHGLSSDQVRKCWEFREEHKVSLPDASSIIVSEVLGAILLTGDGKLRRSAEKLGRSYRGVLWVLDVMIENQVLSYPGGVKALELLEKSNAFVPHLEIDKRRDAWSLLDG